MRQRRKIVALALSLLATVAVLFGGISLAIGAAGDTPTHTKNLTDNQDGTYTLSLDVVGDSEKKPNNINVVVIVDTSGSMTQQRMTAAKNAVNSLANSLYAYNTQSDPNTVEMALVRFATSSSVARTPTNNATQFTNAVNGLGNQGNGGTNWESALQTAYGVDFGDNDQTFAIFVSDGNPTFRTTQNGWYDWSNQYQQWGTGRETDTNIYRCYTTAVDDAQALATKVTPGNFFTIGAFGNVDRMEQLTDNAGSDASTNYYSASDTAALNQAISDILAKIEMAGIAKAGIEDGTTNQVTTTSGKVAKLLEVDTSSFKYYRSNGTYGNMQQWSDAPAAKLVNGEVEWDLSSVGVLENGVRYTVTFDCYPSQYTYDTIAQLKNGDITYDSLDSEVKKYIVDNGNGNYSLRTNTNASLSWDDTRDDAGQQSDEYVNPDPVATAADSLTINKEWDGGDPPDDSLPLTVLMDGEAFHTATLSKDNNWETSSFISVGIIKNGQALSGAPGHDFSFAELDDTQYRWELDAPTVRPMRIGEDIVMLVKVDADHPAPSGADTYTIDGADYYADSAASGLTATNHRRSNLNLTKAVTGEDAPKDATFPFTLTVNNSKAPATEPTDDPDHNSDYWVWFSIYDTKAGKTVTDATVSGATGPNADGYYYAPSGTAISVDMKADWNLRFTNLPSGSTYTFVEGELDNGFAFSEAKLTEGTDTTFSGAQTTTGTIQNTGTAYAVKYTNDYEKTNLEITKVWDDTKNQDGKRLTADDLKAKLTLSPEVEGAEPTIVDNGDDTYTITYTGLPRYNNGTEVEYTVTESAIDGYTTTGSPAKDHGTITNKHETEKTSVKITKVWDDADNQDGIRPASVDVQLKAGDTAQGDRVTLDASNNWTHTWENLDKYANGTEIAYTADEVEVPARYTKEVTGSAAAGFTVTNKHTPDTLTVEGTKTWDDSEYVGKPGYERPESITVHLTGEVTVNGQTSTVVTKDTTTTEADEWKYSFTDLPKNNKGQQISYKVTEDVPTGYEATVDGYNIKNTPVAKEDIIDPVTLEITKTDKVTGDTLAGAVFTVTDAGGKQVATATTDAEGKATLKFVTAGTYTMKETAPNGYVADPGNWTIVVEQSGVDKVEYNKTDSVWNWFYHLFFGSGTDYQQGKMTVTNPPVTTKVTVDKVWDDNNNQDGKRPAELTYTITGKAGNDTVDLSKYDVTDTQTVKVAGDGSASCKWENLPTMYGGTAVTYEVAEAAVDEYTTEVGEISGSAADGYKVIVTNKHEIDKTKVTVTKAWNDNDNADKTRPVSVSVTLSADGTAVGDAVTLNEANNWTYTWENLDVNAAGKAITYTVDEAEVPGYAKSISAISGDATTGYSYTITNSNVTVDASTKAFFKKDVTTPNTIKDATFTFSIEAVTEGAPMPANTTGTASYAAGETGEKAINFGKITYTAAGEYKYKITETNKPDGWTATPESVEVTVTVTGDAANGFTAEVAGGTIENAYGVQPTTASFPVEKILSVAEGLTAPDITGKYTFTLAAVDGAPLPETTSYTNPDKDGGSVTFGDITYTAAGTYTYTVTESGDVNGITNDSAASTGKTVTVEVVDNGDGTLTATPSTNETPVTFTNTYEVGQVTASIPVEKTVKVPEGLTGPTNWTYTITAEAQDGAPVAESMETTVTKASPSSTIGDITFTAPGTYKYIVTESGQNAGITNGTASYDIEIVVTDNSDGTLTAVVNDGKAVAFENTYSVEPTTVSFPVEKELVVPEDLEGPAEWSYTIDVTANDGAPAAETMTGKVDQDTTSITFGDFTYTKPGTYTYTVSETGTVAGVANDTDAAGKTVTVKVVDNGNGTLTATADSTTGEPLTFTNTYSVKPVETSFPVEKVLSVPEGVTGPVEWSYDITVSGTPTAETMTGKVDQANSTATFGPFKYTEPGTYTYTVSETGTVAGVTNDNEATKTVTVEVVDNGDGTLTATADSTTDEPLTFTNTYSAKGTVTPVATKVAKGFELKADQFTFQLKDANGGLVSEAKNAADGSITFGEIGYTAAGEYKYTINEVAVENDGIADDTHVCNVTVKVVDNGNGTLTATAEYSDNKFVNKHNDVVKTVESGIAETYVDGELVQAGDTLTYTITYANNTEGVAEVTVEDTIPANTTYVKGSADPEAEFDGNTLTWKIPNVPAGATGIVTFQVTVNDGANGESIENTAKVDDGENKPSTNAVTTSVPVKDVKDSEGASVDDGSVQVGDTLTFEVSFSLAKDTTSVIVTDAVPANTTLFDDSISDGGAVSDGVITWDLGALPAGDYTVSFQVTVDESAVTAGAITNTAAINVNNHGDVQTNTTHTSTEKGGLTISKTVTVPEGYTIDEDKAFTFTIELTDKNGTPLTGSYAYTGPAEGDEGTLKSGDTFTLKHGEKIVVKGLPAGAKYTITEDAEKGYNGGQETTIAGTIPEPGDDGEPASVEAAFENVYNVEATTIELGASKTLEVEKPANNAPDVSGKYTFTLKEGDEVIDTKTNPDGDGTAVSFKEISYDKPGEHQYTVTETGDVKGVSNGQTSYDVKVKVSDQGNGTLKAEVIEGAAITNFTNTYKVKPTKANFEVLKEIKGTPLTAGAFEFELKDANEELVQTKTNKADGKVTFDEIPFDEPGTFTYTITEVNGGSKIDGTTYSGETVTVTVDVTDNGKGELVADVSYDPEDPTFKNTYEADGDVELSVSKELTGRKLEDGQFTFELVDEDGNVIQTKTNNASGAVQFDSIPYNQDDFDDQATNDEATTEDSGTDDSATDETEEETTGGQSEATTDEASEGEAGDATTGDAKADEAEAAADEAETDEAADAERTATFKYTIREVAGDAPGYTYDTHEVNVTVTVVDNGDGTLTATPAYDGSTEYVNTYEAKGEAQFKGIKTTTGKDLADGQFEFQLKDSDGNVIETVTNGADGSFSFSPVTYKQNAEQTDADTGTFKYTIVEVNDGQTGWTYDSHVCNVTVTVTDNGNGTLATTVEYGDGKKAAFSNPYKPLATSAPVTAKKVLEGRDLKAGEFTFELRDAEGKVVATATNAASGLVDFGYVGFDEVGTYTFTATEVKGSDANVTYDSSTKTYTVEVVDDGGQLVATVTCDDPSATFTNVYKKPDVPGKPGKPKKKVVIPQTGDDTPTGAMAALTVFGAAALTAGTVLQRRKRK
jgi:pilin isopeptide linkage protein/uncharacterized repeat protein (TIGR01451 family)